MSSKNKIVILLPGFPKDESDTNCLPYVQDLLQLLNSSAYPVEFEVVTLHYPFVEDTYYWNDIKVHALGGNNRGGFQKILLWQRSIKTLRKINKQGRIKLIHCFWLNEPAFIAQLFSYLIKTPVLVTIIGQDPLKSNRYLPFLNLSRFKLVGISELVNRKLIESSKKQVDEIIPLVLNIKNLSIKESSTIKSYDVIGVGNLSALKNYTLFIEVIQLVNKIQPIQAAIIGSGYQKDELQRIIDDKKLVSSITLIGEMNREAIFPIMKTSKVLLHTSNYESQGFAMSEALYFGMKVISTNVGDNEASDFIEVGNNQEELVYLVNKALKEIKRESVLFYDPKRAVEQYLNLYQAMI